LTINLVTAAANQTSSKGNTAGALSSQRLGFRGTEDLGGGLKAGFEYELAIGAAANVNDAGANGLNGPNARTSLVSLSDAKLGTIRVGYGLTGLHNTIANHRAVPASNFYGDLAYADNAATDADSRIHLNAVRTTGVTYITPSFNGLTIRVDAGDAADKTNVADTTKSKNLGFTADYAVGALKLAATVHNYKTGVGSSADETDYTAVSAQYTIGAVTLDALYAKNKTERVGVQTGKNDVQQVGVKYALNGKTSLTAMYGTGDGEGAAGAARRDRKGMQLGVMHAMSKRTTAYAMYGSQEAKYVDAVSNGAAGTVEKISGYTVGLRHSF